MKHRIILTIILFITFCIIAGCTQKSMVGGFSIVSVTEKEVVDATAFAIKAQKKTMLVPTARQSTTLELVKILAAKKQVVAGVNYQLNLKIKLDGKEKQAEAVVWWQEWRKPAPYQLTSWKWSDQ